MLEHACLHIHPWNRTAALEDWTRRVTDAAANPLGFVRFEAKPESWWFSWMRGVRLELYETADASHLMTMIRSWGMSRVWEIYDAEERYVGSIYPPSLVDSEGGRRGYLDVASRDQARILDADGSVLATWQRTSSGLLEATFASDPSGNPFLRMLVLAGVIAQEPLPKRR